MFHLHTNSSEMYTCDQCEKILSTAFNLRRHLNLCHNIITPSKTEKTSQIGYGRSDMDSNDSDVEDDVDSTITETESSDINSDDGGDNPDEDWVFDRFLDKIDVKQSLFECQQDFREMYSDFLVWYQNLKQNEIHKKVMETARNLQDVDYDKDESLQAAVDQRKFLLDRIVEKFVNSLEDDDDEEEEQEDEDISE